MLLTYGSCEGGAKVKVDDGVYQRAWDCRRKYSVSKATLQTARRAIKHL
jgi:hypothetical protein